MNTPRGVYLLILFLLLSFPAAAQNDSILYRIKKAVSASPDCPEYGRDTAAGCIEGYMTWPEITGSTNNSIAAIVLDKLRAEISLENHRHFLKEGFGKNPDDVTRTFIKELAAERNEWGEGFLSAPMNYLREISVYFNRAGVFSVGVFEGGYTGGAHPNFFTSVYNYSLATGHIFTPADIFYKDEMDKVLQIAEKEFRTIMEIPSSGDINDHGFWFSSGRFHLSQVFFPTEEGITFIYNPYEVAPYVMGEIRITLPYSAVRKHISSWGPLNSFAEKEQ